MDSHGILRILGHAAQAHEHPTLDRLETEDERVLEAYTLGELSEAELSRLHERARTDPALARALEAHAPLDAAFSQRVVESVRALDKHEP